MADKGKAKVGDEPSWWDPETHISPRAVKTGGLALTGFGLYRAGSKSPVEKTGLKYITRARPYTGRGLTGRKKRGGRTDKVAKMMNEKTMRMNEGENDEDEGED
ncbi:hypothetical protein MTR_6g080490 [Medicago truncatula]|uniref:Uncharacterized protein n=1 Tax=Medicago truncatula TaxID=3880 RepID=G7KLM2_MEDTR|nr:hypothetical protein MTR_6g080490 [Medicago truncatula]